MSIRRRTRSATWYRALALLVALGLLLAAAWTARWVLYPIAYHEAVWRSAEASGLSPYLVAAVIRVESHWRPGATSQKGARGLMQVMPDTAAWVVREFQLEPVPARALYDPEFNIRVGTRYLAYLYEQFDGRLLPALAAYNAGDGPVQEWLTSGLWPGTEATLSRIPYGETRRYLTRVLRDYGRYRLLYGAGSSG